MAASRPGPEQRRAIFQRGRAAEQLAAEYLQARGLKLLERNYRAPCGEIDLIMLDGTTLVFVEVRYRSGMTFCRPEETIDAAKQRRLRATGEHYLQHNPAIDDCRFDIVTLTGSPERPDCQWLTDAF